jgi:hypothetical protein
VLDRIVGGEVDNGIGPGFFNRPLNGGGIPEIAIMGRDAIHKVPDPKEIGGLSRKNPDLVALFEEGPGKVGADEAMGTRDEDLPYPCHKSSRPHPYFRSQAYPISLSKGSSRSISAGSWGIEAQFATIARSFPMATKPFTTPGGTFTRI